MSVAKIGILLLSVYNVGRVYAYVLIFDVIKQRSLMFRLLCFMFMHIAQGFTG